MVEKGDPSRRKRRHLRGGSLSPITGRILFINVLALALLVAGLLYLDEYRKGLIQTELAAMGTQAQMFAAALGETSITLNDPIGEEFLFETARQMVRRLVETTGARARLYAGDGMLIADSRRLGGIGGPGGSIQVEILPPPDDPGGFIEGLFDFYDRVVKHLPGQTPLPVYREVPGQMVLDYGEVIEVLEARAPESRALRRLPRGGMMLSVAVPVFHFKQVIGAILLTKNSHEIDEAVLDVRIDILQVFAATLLVTVLLSIYLARTIARPILRLAAAADRVRRSHHRHHNIPDFAGRGDEIEDLALALRDMTQALWDRMDAIDRFAADVSHEIKNPLTSLRSAVETAMRLKDPEQQRKLMAIIQEDVQRLDRLITDISEASRLDAELSRAEKSTFTIGTMLATLIDIWSNTTGEDGPRLDLVRNGDVEVDGLEDRLVRVFQNLIGNAISFSPADSVITVRTAHTATGVEIAVEDQGPGIPAGKEEAIFERFYSERPESEKFGTHSGLGLSISRQIVEAHGGTIHAENRAGGGARFVVRLPGRATA